MPKGDLEKSKISEVKEKLEALESNLVEVSEIKDLETRALDLLTEMRELKDEYDSLVESDPEDNSQNLGNFINKIEGLANNIEELKNLAGIKTKSSKEKKDYTKEKIIGYRGVVPAGKENVEGMEPIIALEPTAEDLERAKKLTVEKEEPVVEDITPQEEIEETEITEPIGAVPQTEIMDEDTIETEAPDFDIDEEVADIDTPMYESFLPDIEDPTRLEELKNKLEVKRQIYIKAKRALKKASGLLSKIFKRKDDITVLENNFKQAEEEYKEARAEYIGAEIAKALQEQMALVDEQIKQALEGEGNLEKLWEKARGVYKKLGDWNVEKLMKDKPTSWFGKFSTRLASVRTLINGGLVGVGALTGGVGLTVAGAARSGMRFVGTAGLTYDVLKSAMIASEETSGLLKELSREEIAELSEKEIEERMRMIEARSLLDGIPLQKSKYKDLYDNLANSFQEKMPEQSSEDVKIKLERFLYNANKNLDERVEKLESTKKRHQAIAVTAGLVSASGAIGKAVGNIAKETGATDYIKDSFGWGEKTPLVATSTAEIKPEEATTYGLAEPGETAEAIAPEKLSPEPVSTEVAPGKLADALEAKLGYEPIVGKDEGITSVIVEDFKANPENLKSFAGEIKWLEEKLEEYGGDTSKFSEDELKNAARLVYKQDFGAEDLRIDEAGKMAVIFDDGHYKLASLDSKSVEEHLYTRAEDIKVGQAQTDIESGVVNNSDIKSFRPEKGGYTVTLNDGTELKGYVYEALAKDGTSLTPEKAYLEDVPPSSIDEAIEQGRGHFVPGEPEVPTADQSGVTYGADGIPTYEPPLVPIEEISSVVGEEPEKVLGEKISFKGELPDNLKLTSKAEILEAVGAKSSTVETAQVDVDQTPEVEKVVETEAPEIITEGDLSMAETRYEDAFDNFMENKINPLFDKLSLPSNLQIEGSLGKETAKFSRELLSSLSDSVKDLEDLDTTNQEIMKLLLMGNKASDADIANLIEKDVADRVGADIGTLLSTESSTEEIVISGDANIVKFIEPDSGKESFIYNPNFEFSKNEAGELVGNYSQTGDVYSVNSSFDNGKLSLEFEKK